MSKDYRKIYEDAYGKIPVDDRGRPMHIHHINGNHSDNRLENLTLVTIDEHYQIHLDQEDYHAAMKLGALLNLSKDELSNLARKSNEKRIQNGTHNFLDSEFQRNVQLKRIEDGTHHLLTGDIQKKISKKRVEEGTHNFQIPGASSRVQERRIANGSHNFQGENAPSQQKWTCPHCGKTGKGKGPYNRSHGDKCKMKGL